VQIQVDEVVSLYKEALSRQVAIHENFIRYCKGAFLDSRLSGVVNPMLFSYDE
jgi:hypothetical protein